jgi:hypothetical protein
MIILLLCLLPVKKEGGKTVSGSGMIYFIKAGKEKENEEKQEWVNFSGLSLQYARPTSVGLPGFPHTIHMPSAAETYGERTSVPRILAFVCVSTASPHPFC